MKCKKENQRFLKTDQAKKLELAHEYLEYLDDMITRLRWNAMSVSKFINAYVCG